MFVVKKVIIGDGEANFLEGNNTPMFEYINGQLVLSSANDAIREVASSKLELFVF